MHTSIAVITCWYGPYPWYFPYFMHSCIHNPTIDFIIITDNDAEAIGNKPDNVKIIYRTLEEIKAAAKKRDSTRKEVENNLLLGLRETNREPDHGLKLKKPLYFIDLC